MRQANVSNSNSSGKANFLFLAAGVAGLVAADQLAKFLIRNSLPLSASIKLFGFLQIVNITNTGSVFGVLKGTQPYLIALGLMAVAVILVAYPHFENVLHKLGAALITAGILGNTVDRVSRGVVTDFIYVRPWPAFNFADALLCTGLVILVASLILPTAKQHLQPKRQRKKPKGKTNITSSLLLLIRAFRLASCRA